VHRLSHPWAAPVLAALLLTFVAAGCGGGDDGPMEEVRLGDTQEGPGDPAKGKPETLVAALGDSITAGSPLYDPDSAVRESIGSSLDPRSQYEYWVQRRLSGVRFRNCGVFGERTDQIAGRLEGCADGADVLVIQGGINDIAQLRRVKAAARNLRGMVARGKELGLRVALVEVLPWNNGYPGAARKIRRLNSLIADIGRDEDVPVFPWYRTLDDPASPGRMKAGWTDDGNHPSVAGYRRLAEVVELP